jgi:hypothetical protein
MMCMHQTRIHLLHELAMGHIDRASIPRKGLLPLLLCLRCFHVGRLPTLMESRDRMAFAFICFW